MNVIASAIIVTGIVLIGWVGGALWGWAMPRDTDWIGTILVGVSAAVWARSALGFYCWLIHSDRRFRRSAP